jgi:integrase
MFKKNKKANSRTPNRTPQGNFGMGYDFYGNPQLLSNLLRKQGGCVGRVRTLIYPRKEKMNAAGRCPLYLRVTINGDVAQCSLNIQVDPLKWDKGTQELKGRDAESQVLNELIQATKYSIFNQSRNILIGDETCTSREFVRGWLNKDTPKHDFNSWMKEQLDHQWDRDLISYNTYRARDLTCRLLLEYQKKIQFSELDEGFLFDFMKWVKRKMIMENERKGKELVADGLNSINKHLKIIRVYVNIALKQAPPLIRRNPFESIKLTFRHTERVPLSIEHVKSLWQLYLNPDFDQRVNKKVLYSFLFQVHTGLRISDIRTLHKSDIRSVYHKGAEILVIRKIPQKTSRYGKELNIPVPKLFYEYVRERTALVFDKISDQKYNLALKQIALQLGITVNITSHTARHTFATINNYLGSNPMVTMNLLGHSSLDTTSIYTHHVIGEHVETIEKLGQLLYGELPH